MKLFIRSPAGFGLLYSVTLLLLVIPATMIFARKWRPYGRAIGIEVRIARPVATVDETEEGIILVVHGSKDSSCQGEPQLSLNYRPISRDDLRATLKSELSRRGHPIVYVKGEGCLVIEDVVLVIDAVRGAWSGVPVVLLTPGLEKSLQLPQR